MASRGPAQGAKRLQCTFAPRATASGRQRGGWLPRSLGMCVLAKMYYGLWGECRRFRAVWLTRCVGAEQAQDQIAGASLFCVIFR